MSSQREAILGRLDPEAAALLLEVASRPSSLLLSAERVALEDPRGRSPGLLTPQTPGLSRAERQLLSVHRRHLGLLLHELAAGLIWEADRFQDLLLGAHGPRGDERPAAPATVLAHLQVPLPPALDALNLPPHGHSLTARIGSLLQGLTQPHAVALDSQIQACLAVANLLTPSTTAAINGALHSCQRGRPQVAELQLVRIQAQPGLDERRRMVVGANLASARWQLGNAYTAADQFLGTFLQQPDERLLQAFRLCTLISQRWDLVVAAPAAMTSTDCTVPQGAPKNSEMLHVLELEALWRGRKNLRASLSRARASAPPVAQAWAESFFDCLHDQQ